MGKSDNKHDNQIQRIYYLVWMLSYIAVGVVVSLILPFPISLGVLLLVAFLFDIIRTKINLRKVGIQGIKRLYKSSSSSLGSDHSTSNNNLGYAPLKFYCMNCGNEHKYIVCPKCGSKAVKVG